MKRSILFLLLIISTLSAFSEDYGDKIKRINNRHFGMSIGGNYLNYRDAIRIPAIQISALYYGVYFDMSLVYTGGSSSPKLGRWLSNGGYSVKAGYQLPITSGFRIIPTLGVTKTSHGIVDGYNWDITDSGIVNHYYETEKITNLDVGLVFIFKYKIFTLHLTCSSNTLGGGLGLEI